MILLYTSYGKRIKTKFFWLVTEIWVDLKFIPETLPEAKAQEACQIL